METPEKLGHGSLKFDNLPKPRDTRILPANVIRETTTTPFFLPSPSFSSKVLMMISRNVNREETDDNKSRLLFKK